MNEAEMRRWSEKAIHQSHGVSDTRERLCIYTNLLDVVAQHGTQKTAEREGLAYIQSQARVAAIKRLAINLTAV